MFLHKKIILVLAIFMFFYSCGTRKDTVVSRNFQAFTTKYNVLFNGKQALKKGIDDIKKGYKDDFFKQLPIEPIEFDEDKVIAPTFSTSDHSSGTESKEKAETPFDKAEEKAVKAIQKHGMNINGLERNRQIDDAYLLLGKARYYSQRFVPAIEAFNYVIINYPNADLIAETRIWRAKTNVRLDNEKLAIESLKLVLAGNSSLNNGLPDKIKEQVHTAMAMAYIKSDSTQRAKEQLMKATKTLNDREQSARNLFVLGQIYSSENKKDSASVVFTKLANFRKAPRKFKIHANIELVKNSSDSSSVALLKRFDRLIRNSDNRPYLDELYYQMGVLNENKGSIKKAINYYNKSIKAKQGSKKQKTFTYEKLGNLYFKKAEYQLASAYYDSVLKVSTENSLRIIRIKREHKNLASLIKFEDIVSKNDSILKIASLSAQEQKTFFQKYIDNLKEKDKKAAQLKLNKESFGVSFSESPLKSMDKGKWYFYNAQSLNFGKIEFQKNWGNRPLEDNWRWSDKGTTSLKVKDSLVEKREKSRYNLISYLEKIPTKKATIDSLKTDRNQALYELGVIYKEQFKNSRLAIERLERVAFLEPKKELILPINWYLYQIYKKLGNSLKANKHKDVILRDYPKTKFAQLIQNPRKKFKEEASVDKTEKMYEKMYHLYKENKFEQTVTKINQFIKTIPNSRLIPKFELLKSYAIGKYKNKQAYRIALEYIIISYGNTQEGKKAKEILKQLNK